MHHRNIQRLATELYKVKNGFSPEIIKEIFTERDMRYNIRGQSDLILPNPKTVSFGTESVKFLGPKIWNIIPNPINNASSLFLLNKK